MFYSYSCYCDCLCIFAEFRSGDTEEKGVWSSLLNSSLNIHVSVQKESTLNRQAKYNGHLET